MIYPLEAMLQWVFVRCNTKDAKYAKDDWGEDVFMIDG
jgi:hypothetical protein